jgi:hypothetical protein
MGLYRRSLRDALTVTLWCALGFFAFEVIFVYITAKFQDQMMGPVLKMPFVRDMVRAMLGSDFGDTFTPAAFGAMAWVHPAVLALLWAHTITIATRAPVGAIDRATIDFTLGLPVTRRAYWFAETGAWLTSFAALLVVGLVGHQVGELLIPAEGRLAFGPKLRIVANLIALMLAVGGVTLLMSAVHSRRGPAVGWTFAIVLVSFLLAFVVQIWPPAKPFAPLSILTYYRPLAIAQTDGWPVRDLAVLLSVAAVTWSAGWFHFSRRDIATV